MDVSQKIHRICGRSKQYLKYASPVILCCVAAVGVTGTAVAAAKATPKARRLLEETEKEKGRLGKTETVITAAPAYIPAVAIGIGTIACIFGANALSRKRQASIASACILLNNYHKEYRKKLIELNGDETDVEIRNAMVREHCNYHLTDSDVPEGKIIFYDELSGETFVRYERDVIDAEYHLNRNFVMRGYASLNEFYEFLGIPETKYGGTVGWTISDGYCWIDFEHRLISGGDSRPDIYSIDMLFPPDPDYLREWQ